MNLNDLPHMTSVDEEQRKDEKGVCVFIHVFHDRGLSLH